MFEHGTRKNNVIISFDIAKISVTPDSNPPITKKMGRFVIDEINLNMAVLTGPTDNFAGNGVRETSVAASKIQKANHVQTSEAGHWSGHVAREVLHV